MVDKVSNLFDAHTGRCVHLFSQNNSAPLLPEGTVKYVHIWHHSKFAEDANRNKQKLCYCQSNNFSGTNDTVKHFKTFRIISNEKPILLLSYVDDILALCRCIQRDF